MPQWAALYTEHVADLGALAGGLTPQQRETTVPATPRWTVREVYAHVAGVASDSLAGRTDGAPGEEWTARHVAERASLSLDELVEELTAQTGAVAARLTDGSFPVPMVLDIATHHADVHEALGKHQLPDHLWQQALSFVERRIPPELAAAAPPYEQFRAVLSRRSRGQMQAWHSGLDDDQLDAVPVFGPRDDDQPVPPTHD